MELNSIYSGMNVPLKLQDCAPKPGLEAAVDPRTGPQLPKSSSPERRLGWEQTAWSEDRVCHLLRAMDTLIGPDTPRPQRADHLPLAHICLKAPEHMEQACPPTPQHRPTCDTEQVLCPSVSATLSLWLKKVLFMCMRLCLYEFVCTICMYVCMWLWWPGVRGFPVTGVTGGWI